MKLGYIKKKFIHLMGIYNFEGIGRLFNFFHIIEPRRLKNWNKIENK